MTVGELFDRLGAYTLDTPVMRVVEGDPLTYGVDPVILRELEFVGVEGAIALSARGYYQRHRDAGSMPAIVIR